MKKFWNWKTALMGVVTALLMSVIAAVSFYFYCAYLMKNTSATHVVVMENAQENEGSVISMTQSGEDAQIEVDATPSVETLKNLYGYVYVLYKELCDNQRRREGKEPYVRYQDLIYDPVTALNLPKGSEENAAEIRNAYETAVTESRTRVENRLSAMESSFYEFNNRYDYWMFDEKYPAYVLTNTDHVEISSINSSPYAYLFRIDYDKNGVATISNRILQGTNREKIRKNLNTLLHEKPKVILGGDVGEEYGSDVLQSALEKATSVKNPASCSVIMGITWDKYRSAYGIQTEREEEAYFRANFHTLSVRVFAAILFGAGALWGAFWLNPGKEEKRADRILARAPFELVVALIFLVYCGGYMLQEWLAELVLSERLDYVSAWIYVFFLCLVTWYAGGCLGEMRILGPGGYLKKRWILLMGLRALGRHLRKVYDDYRSLNLGMNLRKRIIALVVINGVLVSIFCCGWFLGIIAVIIYSVCLYFLAMRYLISVQKDYQKLRRMTKEMADGNLKYEPEESLGLYEPAKEDLVQIRNGFDKAVQEEVKSQKMKSELITNVSHDLKTPLTAIITYVNLLKDKNLTEEQRASYVDTLDKKSLRLKRLIEDLFEVSKANSGNVQLNLRDCDLTNLIKQCFYEVEDKLQEKNLTTRLTFPEEKVMLKLDGEKTYRIYENLFNNIVKYAMAGTRVYVTMTEDQERVFVTVKNITEAELYVPAQELTERFVRGDASRGTVEGSGLGLAIVRSFTELQGGKLELEVDGDLFKVTTIWMKQ